MSFTVDVPQWPWPDDYDPRTAQPRKLVTSIPPKPG